MSSKSEIKVSDPVLAKWSGSFEGDPAAQSGTGTRYKIFMCDQNISAKSLVVTPTNGAQASSASVSLERGNALCGSNFDTIFAQGDAPKSGTAKFTVTGKTNTGDAINYNYSIVRS